jgi:hypothetical protein
VLHAGWVGTGSCWSTRGHTAKALTRRHIPVFACNGGYALLVTLYASTSGRADSAILTCAFTACYGRPAHRMQCRRAIVRGCKPALC